MVLGELFAPKREDERVQAAIARYRVGRKVLFCLLNGVRHHTKVYVYTQVAYRRGLPGNSTDSNNVRARQVIELVSGSWSSNGKPGSQNAKLIIGKQHLA